MATFAYLEKSETIWATVTGGALAEFVLWEDVEGDLFATIRVANRPVRQVQFMGVNAVADARAYLNEEWKARGAVRFDMAKARKDAAERRALARTY